MEADLSFDRLKSLLRYDPESGQFTWLVRRGNRAAGAPANSVDGKGYIRVKIDGFDYRAHRLAWFYMHGVWPSDQIDHIDLVRKNNAFTNLREANNSFNGANRRPASNNKSGFKGVMYDTKRKKWRAAIKKDGKERHLGRFANKLDAISAYSVASAHYFGEFSRTN